MWFIFALITLLAWGSADLFYKKGADEADKYSHLKTTMMVGFVMGAHAIATLIFTGWDYDPINLVMYLPVSAMYISSMAVGYLGLRYLELSIASPIQNASGAVVAILCLVILGQKMSTWSAVGVVLICVGVFVLGLLERGRDELPPSDGEHKKYRSGVVAILFPIGYCILDSLGTFFDAWYLDDFETTLLRNVTEDNLERVANISYELTFFFCALVIFVFMLIKKQNLTGRPQGSRLCAAVLETAGQFTYVYAMSGHGAVAAPMIGSFCIVSVLLSRIFLKEKLTFLQYLTVGGVILGLICLGISEGLAD